MNKENIKTTDWLTRGIPKEQLKLEKREAIMSAHLEECMSFNVWAERETGEKRSEERRVGKECAP